MDRRGFMRLSGGGILAALGGCGAKGTWPDGMQEIKWDRDTCVVCNMVISDRRFAGEMRGGPKNIVFKFDDPGCVALWLNDKAKAATYPWIREPATRLWIADVNSRGQDVVWLDARRAQYVTKTSPMGFNFGAVAHAQAGSVDFPTMCEHVVTKFNKGRS
jgi:copper chaperone NosL